MLGIVSISYTTVPFKPQPNKIQIVNATGHSSWVQTSLCITPTIDKLSTVDDVMKLLSKINIECSNWLNDIPMNSYGFALSGREF